MKGCDYYGMNIQLYLDKELTAQDLKEFRSHLKECHICRTELESEEAYLVSCIDHARCTQLQTLCAAESYRLQSSVPLPRHIRLSASERVSRRS
jgi:hypothetical protein